MRGIARCYDELRAYCQGVPLIDCHDHSGTCGPKYTDPVMVVIAGYYHSEATNCLSDKEAAVLGDSNRSIDERWPLVERAWKASCHTGYAHVTRRVLKKFYGADALTLDVLKSMVGRMPDYTDAAAFEAVLEEANIAARILDIWPDLAAVLNGTLKLTPRGRLAISLPRFHGVRDYWSVQSNTGALDGRHVTSLDEYLDACREIFAGCKKFGAVCFKDQCAYSRTLAFENPSRAAAEEIFNWFMADPRRSAGFPDAVKPLDDFLFHQFMRMARELDLPVQIHTGHMAGIRNDIVKTNAIGLTSVIELHRDVHFDLFHANWPYAEEFVYLGKNFPNVTLDFCWANIIDPVYCQRLFQQILSSVPHSRVHAYGSDFGGNVDRAWAHADIARDNIAIALSGMVEIDYISLDDAKAVARDWMFENPNRTFKLGL
ncbi:MAG: amidohydrolase family protein [Planctomycetaceae bacterium]|nr:amidohydrolase family protein [Planctomycetaceae bacterium]